MYAHTSDGRLEKRKALLYVKHTNHLFLYAGEGEERRGSQDKVVALRRPQAPPGAESQHVRALPRRPGESDGLEAGGHPQPRRQVPTTPPGVLYAIVLVCIYVCCMILLAYK